MRLLTSSSVQTMTFAAGVVDDVSSDIATCGNLLHQ